MVYAPFEYNLICEAVDPDRKNIRSAGNVVNVVETIAYASDNPVFRTPEFRMALIDYRIYGKFTRNRVKWSVKQAMTASQSNLELITNNT